MSKLMECKTCEGKLSSSATSCPHCGEDYIKKQSFITKIRNASIGAVVFFFGLVWIIGKIQDVEVTQRTNYVLAEPKIHKKNLQKQKSKFIALVKKEKKVFGPTWESDDVLTLGMTDNGLRRDGFAQYICILKNEAGLEGHRIFVKIYDAERMINSGEYKVIGKTTCN